MKKEQMVGTRLSTELLRDLELIEAVEQADRSTTVRKLLHTAIAQWKLDHYARQYGDGKISLARAARDAGVPLWEMMEHVRRSKIASQYDLAEWEKDVETVSRRIGPERRKRRVPR